MPIKTAREEAWENNFYMDLVKMAKEILIDLNDNFPLDTNFQFSDYTTEGRVSLFMKGNTTDHVVINLMITTQTPNPKVRYGIFLNMLNATRQRKESLLINVSHREEYTKAALERAKKRSLTKIYEFLKL